MIETEQQRRWWFATHPEFSSSATGERRNPHDEDDDEEDTGPPSPEAVDAAVDERLKYERDNVRIALLEGYKKWFGTEFQSKTPAEKEAMLREDEDFSEADDESGQGPFGSAYGWAKDNSEEALDLALSYLLGSLAGPNRVERAIRSLEKRLAEHEQKLADYMRNPEAYDNKGLLKNAATPELRQQIYQGRIRVLQKQIDRLKRDIGRLKGGIR